MNQNNMYHEELMTRSKAILPHYMTDQYNHEVFVDNPLCGDHLHLYGQLENQHIVKLGYKVNACNLCKASLSILMELYHGQNYDYIKKKSNDLFSFIENKEPPNPPWKAIECFKPVQLHMNRHECVFLPFKAVLELIS